MFTLFFGGNVYAPGVTIEGEPVQDWLQERYLAAMRHCYRRLKNCKAIAGWGTMNEPHPGFIGYQDLSGLENCILAAGAMPSPLQAMAAASGLGADIPVYTTGLGGRRVCGHQHIPAQASIFKEGFSCPWKQAGVWTDEGGTPRLLKPDHFARYNGRPADFTGDFLKPFMLRFISRMREADEKAFFFIEGVPNGTHPSWSAADGAEPSADAAASPNAPAVVNAFHWYDGLTLYTKFFRPWLNADVRAFKPILGRKNVAASFSRSLAQGVEWSRDHMENMPSLLGEFGLPFDMNGKRAYRSKSSARWRLHEEALSMYYDALDDNLLHGTIWNYTADNTNAHGDGWNGEDLSIFSEGEGRAIRGWLRPYPIATAGTPLSIRWDRKKGRFTYRFRADPRISVPTEILAPPECFGTDPEIRVHHGSAGNRLQVVYEREQRRIFVFNEGFEGEAELDVRRR
jgi:hypothetical protein